jgi:DNA-binding NarL/FixJ family response regulator
MKKIKLKLLELEDILKKTRSNLNKKKQFVDLYHNALKGIYKNVEQLSYDHSFNRIVNSDSEQVKRIAAHLHSVLYKNNTWDTIYNTGKSTFDKIKILYPEFTENELKIVCLDCLGFTNTMIANTVGLKPNTVQQQKTNIRTKLNIEGSIGSFILKQIDPD